MGRRPIVHYNSVLAWLAWSGRTGAFGEAAHAAAAGWFQSEELSMKIDYQKVSSWLSERWKPPASCPVCKKNSWNLSETAFELRALGRSAGVEASAQAGPMWSGIPEARGMEGPEAGETTIVVPVTCGVCGHVLLFDARRLGVA